MLQNSGAFLPNTGDRLLFQLFLPFALLTWLPVKPSLVNLVYTIKKNSLLWLQKRFFVGKRTFQHFGLIEWQINFNCREKLLKTKDYCKIKK